VDGNGNFMKNIQKQIEQTYEDMKDVAMEIVDGLDIENDIGDDYACFIDKELYDHYQKLNGKHTKLHEKLKVEEAKQLKFALKK
jgi:hypothetical protein